MYHAESDHLIPIQNWFLRVHGAKLLPLEARTVHGDVGVPLCPHCLPTFGADTHRALLMYQAVAPWIIWPLLPSAF